MDFKPVLELIGSGHVPGEELTGDFLNDALANFSVNPVSAITSIRRLQASDPSALAVAAVRLLVSAEEKSPGLQYIAGLIIADDLLTDLLLDERLVSLEAAVVLARQLASEEPLLDVRLVRKVVAQAQGHVGTITKSMALRLLGLVDEISDCSRLASYLVQFLAHPNDRVRSKAALLLGRCNWNLKRIEALLASPDSRLRANAVESLWGHPHEEVRKILWGAVRDKCSRVVVNALFGLCQAGDREAHTRLMKLPDASDPVLRSGAAWAMGELGDPEFGETLAKLGSDHDAKVRAMAERSRQKLRTPEPIVPPPLIVAPPLEEGTTGESSTVESPSEPAAQT